MPNFCSIVVCGHLGQDAKVGETKNGYPKITFSVAYNADKESPPAWYRCTMVGNRGEKLAPMLTKGTAVIVSGPLDARVYTDKNGVERTSLDVRVNELSFAGSRGEQIPAPTKDKPEAHPSTAGYDDSGDVPF